MRHSVLLTLYIVEDISRRCQALSLRNILLGFCAVMNDTLKHIVRIVRWISAAETR